MEPKSVHRDQLIWDLEGRVNPDIESLKKSIIDLGIISPLIVEGPNEDNKYFIIDGHRRYLVLKQLRNESLLVPIRIIGCPSNKLERKKKRFQLQNTTKKIIGAEEEFLIEDIQNEGNYTDNEVIQVLNPKKNRIKRMEKRRSVDKKLRQEVAVARGSQHALEILYSLDISEIEREKLYQLLISRHLTGVHADALLKVHKQELFTNLDDKQKAVVMNRAFKHAKFDNEKANLIVLTELMKSNPTLYNTCVTDWINYVCETLEEYTEFIHPNFKNHSSEFQKKHLRSSLTKLNNLLDWTWDQRYKNEKQEKQSISHSSFGDIFNTKKGYIFKKHN